MKDTNDQLSTSPAMVGNNVLAPVKLLIRQMNGIQCGELTLDLKHPNMEKFFSELNEECLLEDKQKKCEHSWVYKVLHDHTAKNVCEKCHLVVNQ